MTLDALVKWAAEVPAKMPEEMRPMAESIVSQFLNTAKRLEELGLGYLTLDRAGATLSTGERQRVQLARSVRSRTTGALYVLDEPSIGLHPANVEGLLGVVRDLVSHGNSVVMVDHDTRVLRAAEWMIEMGPGRRGGRRQGSRRRHDKGYRKQSRFADRRLPRGTRAGGGAGTRLARRDVRERARRAAHEAAAHGARAGLEIPKGRLTVVTGVSGSGKTTLVLESLVPALKARIAGEAMPAHIDELEAEGIKRANLIDATPVGANVRSTVATYCGVLDDLRKLYAASPEAKKRKLKAGDFSYNTGSLRCPDCDGTGQITMDVQFLPDVEIICPSCGGGRYSEAARGVTLNLGGGEISLPELMALTVDQAREKLSGVKGAGEKLRTLSELGLGYLTLGEATPALSGGEAQRLKLAAEMGRAQDDAVFVFDEPTIGLHPLDVRVLTGVLSRLIEHGATVVVIEHDLDMIANADYVIDMGPGGGDAGGRIVAAGTPEEVAASPESVTGRYLAEALRPQSIK